MVTKNSGFTLIELLIVIAIIAILAGVVIVALNPARQFASGRNSQRSANTNALLNAIGQRVADGRGTWNTTCGTTTVALPSTATNIGSGAGLVNLEPCLVPTYIPTMVWDPDGNAADTKYTVVKNAQGRITVAAPLAELGETISIAR